MINLQETQGSFNVGNAVTPQQPVRRENIGGAIAGAVSNVSDIFTSQKRKEAADASAKAKLEEEANQDAVRSAYFQEVSKISSAYQSGKITREEARTRTNAALVKIGSEFNGNYTDELMTFHNKVMESEGFGMPIAQGTEQDQQYAKLVDAAITDGFVSPYASDEEKANAVAKRQELEQKSFIIQKSSERLQALREVQAYKQSLSDAQLSELNYLEKKTQMETQQFFVEASLGYTDKINVAVEEAVRTAMNNGRGAEAIEQGNQSLNALMSELNSFTAQVSSRGGVDASRINGLKESLGTIIENGRKLINGDITQEAYDKVVANRKSLMQYALTNDPKVLAVTAVSEMWPQLGSLVIDQLAPQIPTILENAANGQFFLSNDPETVDQVAMVAQINAQAFLDGELSVGALEATQDVINGIFKNISMPSELIQDNPKQFDRLIKFIAEPSIGEFIQDSGKLDLETQAKAKNAIQTFYDKELLPLIRDSQRYKIRSGARNRSQGALLDGAELKMVGKNVVLSNPTASKVDPDVVERFNKEVGPILTRGVRAMAHLSGTTDYSTVLQTLSERLGLTEEQQDAGQEDNRSDADILAEYGVQ